MKTKGRILILAGLFCCAAPAGLAAAFTVINTNDSGPGSLREAITSANTNAGPDAIVFNISTGGVQTINLLSALPKVSDPVLIDGTSEPGFAGLPLIELNGTNAGAGANGLRLTTSNCIVRGLVINRFPGNGIEVDTNGNNVIEGNIIGLDSTGTLALGNHGHGVNIYRAPGNLIGGTGPGARNVIAANTGNGIELDGAQAKQNVVQGNYIGLNILGNKLGNAWGLYFDYAPTNQVGGTNAGSGNVISGNGGGILIYAPVMPGANSALGNSVLGNLIGTDPSGTQDRGNGGVGVSIYSGSANLIGVIPNGGNVMAFNSTGISIGPSSATNNAIRGNSIYGNRSLGIDLNQPGVTTNDPLDAIGPQNFPLLPAATCAGPNTIVQGIMSSRPNSVFDLDFFASPACSSSGYGQGQTYLWTASITTDAGGTVPFNVTLPGCLEGQVITATATDSNGNTSEFSACLPVLSPPVLPLLLTVSNTNDSGPGSLRQAILDANASTTTVNTIAFNLPDPGLQVIAPLSPLPPIAVPLSIDGFTQPGSKPNSSPGGTDAQYLIQLDGVQAGPQAAGLTLLNNSNLIRGLIITRFSGDGILLASGVGTVIKGNLLGIAADGSARSNAQAGVHIAGAAFNTVGGTEAGDRNVISGNGAFGISLDGNLSCNNLIAGNFIGTDLTGTLPRPNWGGILVTSAPNNVIGGTNPACRNIISGNTRYAIYVSGGVAASGNAIQGNFAGVDVTGTAKLGSSRDGFTLEMAGANLIGGASPGAGNVISAFNRCIAINLSHGNRVQGNFVGTDSTGTLDLGNIMNTLGIYIEWDTGSNIIGGIEAGAGNTIAFEFGGVRIGAGNSTLIRGNSISRLGSPGILDLISGPTLLTATTTISNTVIQGTLQSATNAAVEVDFYSTELPDFGPQGQYYLGTSTILTDNNGFAAFNVTLPTKTQGRYITATATGPDGATSEFSLQAVLAATTIPPMTFTVTNANDDGPGSLRQAIFGANATITTGQDTVAFNIPADSLHTIIPHLPLPEITDSVLIDGYSQPGANQNTLSDGQDATLLIRLDGAQAGPGANGFKLHSGTNTIRGIIITRFQGDGILIYRGAGNVLQGNWIGVDENNTSQGNGTGIGVSVLGKNQIGGTSPGARNVISGNALDGVYVQSGDNSIQGNFIGTDLSGAMGRGNGRTGFYNDWASANAVIGGLAPGSGNRIAFNGSAGVAIPLGNNNSIRGNSIFGNLGLGIDLGLDGITMNDPGDTDGGANQQQNFPVLTDVTFQNGSTIMAGALNSASLTTYGLDFFRNGALAPSGYGQGEFYLGSMDVTTDLAGNASFVSSVAGTFSNDFFTATATDPSGNTSEFSAGVHAPNPARPPLLSVIRSGPGLDMVWPMTEAGFGIEWAESLEPPIHWWPLTNQPLLFSNRFVIHLGVTESNQFFRLGQP